MTNRYHIKGLLLTLALLMLALPALGEDAPIYTTSATLSENTAPIGFRVYATAEGDPIYTEAMLYRLDYDLPDGSPANDPLYFSSFDADDMQSKLHFVDLNCDGYLDLEALRALGASGLEATYFIYHPANGRFVEEPELTKLTVYQIYPKQKLLVSYAHDSAATGVYAMFRWSEDGYTPYLYRVASFLGDGRPDSTICRDYVAEYDQSGAKVQVYRDETCDMYIDEDEWNRRNDERMRLFWQGLDSTEAPAQPQGSETLFYNPQGGRYYHSVAQCRSISSKYWEGMAAFDRAALGEDGYSALLPCPICCANEVTP